MPYLKILWSSLLKSRDNELFEISGFVAYTFLLSFFPFLILLISVTATLGDSHSVQTTIFSLLAHLPKEISEIIRPVVKNILSGPVHGLISFSVIGILWASSSGIEAIRLALNKAYEKTESRSFFYLRGQSLCLILFCILALSCLSFFFIILPAPGIMPIRSLILPIFLTC